MATLQELSDIATQVRRDSLRMINAVNSGHPGAALGCADLMTALFFEIMKHKSVDFSMEAFNEDVFYLSNGHVSALFYSVLARSGYFSVSELNTFRKINSRLQGHPATAEHLPGVRIASGSLGQGLSVAVGHALSKRLNNDSGIVYCLTGDGELQEGQIWEAAMFAAAKKVDNLIAIVDYNRKQIDGSTDDVLSLGNLGAKWLAFDWDVIQMDGNNMAEVVETLQFAKTRIYKQKPVVILMHTEMGYGVDFMMGTHKWHGSSPNDEQLKIALSQLKETIGDFPL